MTPEVIEHYAVRLTNAADAYERDASADAAWALILALGLARSYGVGDATMAPVISALETHEAEILEAAIDYGLGKDYAQQCEEYAQRADYAVDEWADQAAGFLILHFELQAAHDWIADRILAAETIFPLLAARLEHLGSAVSNLAAAIERHGTLFSVAQLLHEDLIASADQRYITNAYRLSRAISSPHAEKTTGPANDADNGGASVSPLAEARLAALFARVIEEQRRPRIAADAGNSIGRAGGELNALRLSVAGDPTISLKLGIVTADGGDAFLTVEVIGSPMNVGKYPQIEVGFFDGTASTSHLAAGWARLPLRDHRIAALSLIDSVGSRHGVTTL